MERSAHPERSRLRAVLFDMDGTLVDSEKLWAAAVADVADALGGTLSSAARDAVLGTDLATTARLLLDDTGSTATTAEVELRIVDAAAIHYSRDLVWRPGADCLLTEVRRAGLATALVTSSYDGLVSIVLRTIGRERFDVVVSADDVASTKPDPQPYRRALELLGILPSQAIAIEDSPAGSASARAAGLLTVVVPSQRPVPAAPGLVLRPSLTGIDVAWLRGILQSHSPDTVSR